MALHSEATPQNVIKTKEFEYRQLFQKYRRAYLDFQQDDTFEKLFAAKAVYSQWRRSFTSEAGHAV